MVHPGTVHRLINGSGDLEVTVVMQNAGIPEAGDAVFTFPEEVLDDPDAYSAAATAPAAPDLSEDERGKAARARRDLAVEGYLKLRERVEAEGADAMRPLWDRAARLVSGRTETWRKLWEAGPKTQADATGEHLTALAAADSSHLCDAHVSDGAAAPANGACADAWRPGTCVPSNRTPCRSGAPDRHGGCLRCAVIRLTLRGTPKECSCPITTQPRPAS
ncbi:hypothetical protein GCM10029992_52030 [Glycomyces albus]